MATAPPGSGALRSNVASFSPSVNAGGSTLGCKAALVPAKPCNLDLMQVQEPKGSPQGKEGSRIVQVRRTDKRQRAQSPVVLRSGQDAFNITATSVAQGKRKLVVTAQQAAHCGQAGHKQISVVGPGLNKTLAGNSVNLELARAALPGDNGFPFGLWAVINACWLACRAPARYTITSHSCGLPASAKGAPAPTLAALVDVWPADQFKLTLAIPALLEPSALKLDKATNAWTTDAQRDAAERKKEADSYFQEHKDFLREAGVSRADVRDFVSKMGKTQTGEDDERYVDKLKIDFAQTDGNRVLKAPIDDAIKLVRAIRSAEYAVKQIDKWLENATVGPGASVSIAVQFFSGTISAGWGQVEYIDDRVFLGWNGAIDVELVKLELKLAVGWRCAGLADLFIEIGGEGAISVSTSGATRGPDEEPEVKCVPKGEIKLSGSIKAQLMWAVKGETGLECTFKAEVGDLKFMQPKGSALAGTVTIGRDPVYRVITYSNRLFGGSTTEKEEVIKADEQLAVFKFG